MFSLIPLLFASPAGAGEEAQVSATITAWMAYAPGLAAPSVEKHVKAKTAFCAEKYSESEFDLLTFNVRFGPEQNTVTLIEPTKLESRAVVRCIRDELVAPMPGQPSDTRGSVNIDVKIGAE
ncbi:MAG: hypothetical protein VX899_13740 [Myxococcota bacterium]|nr:hypothetical protein [Myxococcota bacterium]